jgi:hypothetical protein
MAKVSKAAKTKSTKAKAAKKKVAQPVTPVYLESPATIRIGLHDVIRALKMIETQGQLNKLVSASKRQRLQVTLPAETVNFVKDFVVKHGLHTNQVGRHIVGGVGTPPARGRESAVRTRGLERSIVAANSGDPNQCQFGRAG